MKRFLLPLLFAASTQADAGQNNEISPALIAEHCDLHNISARELLNLAGPFAERLADASTVTGDEMKLYEMELASKYLKEVRSLPYSKMKAGFAKVQRNTNLADAQSILETEKQLTALEKQLVEADNLLDKHTTKNSGGNYDLSGFTPSAEEVKTSDVSEVFDSFKKEGIDCGADVQAFYITNGFPGTGQVIASLVNNAGIVQHLQILPDVESFNDGDQETNLKTEKAKFMARSEALNERLLKSELRALRVETLIKTAYPKL